MPTPPLPQTISGKVTSWKGIVSNATITITSGSDSATASSDNLGRYQINASEVNAVDGDSITIKAEKTSFGTKSETIVLASPQTQDFFLEQTSDFSFEKDEPLEGETKYLKYGSAILLDFEGNEITVDNPLFVKADQHPFTQRRENISGSYQPRYIGHAPPGTDAGTAKWRIQKLIYDDGNNYPPTQILWAEGNAEFDKTWDSRADYLYS